MPVGSLSLANPVMTASGTAGHGDELEAYVPLAALGAVVVKSLSADPWPGNPAPRVHQAGAGCSTAWGSRVPGSRPGCGTTCPAWRRPGPARWSASGAQRVDDFAGAAALLAGLEGLAAVEVNVSCPNVEDRRHMFAHSPAATAEVLAAVAARRARACPCGPS